MKSIILMLCLAPLIGLSQQTPWSYEVTDNPFGSPMEMIFSANQSGMNYSFIAIGTSDSNTVLTIGVGYLCDEEYRDTQIAFKVHGNWESKTVKEWGMRQALAQDKKSVTFYSVVHNESGQGFKSLPEEFIRLFKTSSHMAIKVNNSHCGIEQATYSLNGTTAALKKFKTLVTQPKGYTIYD